MSDYKKIILKNSPVPDAVPLADFLDFGELALNYADKKLYYKELGGGIVVHETPYLDVEGSQNSVVKRNGDGSGVFNGVISNVSDPDLYAIDASHSGGTVARITSTNSHDAIDISANNGAGANINSTSGIGANISSTSGIGSIISSGNSTAAIISSNSSTYHAEFGNIATNNSSAIERIRGAFVWFYNTFKGRLQTANITADRNWTLPDSSGTILLDSAGTSDQFLKADGSVDSTTYAPAIAPIDSTISGSGKTFSDSDSGKIFHITGTNTLVLPTYASVSDGWTVGIVNVGGSTLTFNIAGGSGNTINDGTTFSNTVKWSSLYIYKSDISGKFIAIGILY